MKQLFHLYSISLMRGWQWERMNYLPLSFCLINPVWGLTIISSPATHPDKWFVPALLILTQNYIIHLSATETLYVADLENSRGGFNWFVRRKCYVLELIINIVHKNNKNSEEGTSRSSQAHAPPTIPTQKHNDHIITASMSVHCSDLSLPL